MPDFGVVDLPVASLRSLRPAPQRPVERFGDVSPQVPDAPAPGTIYRRRLDAREIATQLWGAREIVRTLAERDIRVRYKQAALGFAWSLITPLGLLVAFTVLFNRAAKVSTDGVPYVLFAYVGLIPWSFFSSAVANGGSSILSDKGLLNKTYFPREVFPLNALVVAAFDACTSLVPMVVLFSWYQRAPGLNALWVPVPLLVLVVFASGTAFAMSAIIVYLRDLRLALPLLLQMGLFLTPVGYGIDLIPDSIRYPYAFLDPVAPVIESLRNVVLYDRPPHWSTLGVGAFSALIVFVGGWALFKRLEVGFADVA